MKKLFVFVLACVLLMSTAAFAAASEEPAVASDCAHHYEIVEAVEATCTEKGLITYACTECGASFSLETLPVGHSYAVATVAATCEEAGYDQHTCVNCGDSYADNFTPALGHAFTEQTIPATCAADGAVVKTCTTCGAVEETVIPALDHTYVYQNDAVTDAAGAIVSYGTKVCSTCGAVAPATADDYVAPAAAASGEASAEPAAAASGEASAEPVVEEAAAVEIANPNYDPDGYNWTSICLVMVVVIVVATAVLMLSFGKKKKED